MGGSGSGRYTGRPTTGGALSLDLARIRARKTYGWQVWRWSLAGEPMGSCECCLTDERGLLIRYMRGSEEVRETIPTTTTFPHFGGERQWLLCPCGRRCRVVYRGRQGWRCRVCYRLAYPSQREDGGTRAQRIVERIIRHRLKGDPDDDCYPAKPKGMHLRTYDQLVDKCEKLSSYVDTAGLYRVMRMLGMA